MLHRCRDTTPSPIDVTTAYRLLTNVSEDRMVEIRENLMIDLSPINLGEEQMTTAAKVTDNDAWLPWFTRFSFGPSG